MQRTQERLLPSNSVGQRPPVVCLTGPESTGKTSLAVTLATTLQVPCVTEAARDLLRAGEPYDEKDLRAIAAAQLQREQAAIAAGAGAVLDTDVLVIAVWWRVRFATHAHEPWPDWLSSQLQQRSQRLYLLCLPDLEWQPDPLRESPRGREILLQHYRGLLGQGSLPWTEIGGQGPERSRVALAAVTSYS
ncbi:MAG: AAA family ATPase [Pseudomonadales bacterium]